MSKKLFLFDIDGTLYDNDNAVVPPSTVEAIKKLAKYHHVGIATGRAEFMLYSIEELLELFNDFVLINGQYIKADGEIIYSEPIDKSKLAKICKQMDELDIIYGFQGSHKEAISKLNERAISSFNKVGLELPQEDKFFYLDNDVFQAWTFCSEEDAKILAKDNPYFQFIRWLDVGYDILPKSANKWLGIKRLIKHLNIKAEDVIVFGDGDNDVEMLEHAGLGIAMGNATTKAKSVADYITTSVDQDGIYNALKHFKYI